MAEKKKSDGTKNIQNALKVMDDIEKQMNVVMKNLSASINIDLGTTTPFDAPASSKKKTKQKPKKKEKEDDEEND